MSSPSARPIWSRHLWLAAASVVVLGTADGGAPGVSPGGGSTVAQEDAGESAASPHRNRLAEASSPYLRQHAHNPVDWYPWGEEALNKARREDKPIFLSIGYSACHWCHVMAHESFENATIAAFLNKHFIAIKVDREERPDLDNQYMTAVQLLSGRGGWPLSVFLTPDLRPFYGGTYFPPEDRYGMPGFPRVLQRIADMWADQRDDINRSAATLTDAVQRQLTAELEGGSPLTPQLLRDAVAALAAQFDPVWGGIAGAPKFPPSAAVRLFLSGAHLGGGDGLLDAAVVTLDHMADGGMYDQLGGGFHRYSTDARWLVPHFEKMLYDNALLTQTYLEAYQLTGNERYRRVVTGVVDYVLAEMTAPNGGFYGSQDADSEGEEGRYYVWTREEILRHLGDTEGKLFCRRFGVTAEGNFEGRTILTRRTELSTVAKEAGLSESTLQKGLERARRRLLEIRGQRVPPATDDKIIASWNALMTSSLARAAQTLHEPRYRRAAVKAGRFLLNTMRRDGLLAHCYRDGHYGEPGFLDDYAAAANAFVDLYELEFDVAWLDAAEWTADTLRSEFGDEDGAGFFFASKRHRDLLVRGKQYQDGATPGGNSLAAQALLRLSRLTGKDEYSQAAEALLRQAAPLIQGYPQGTPFLQEALEAYLGPAVEVVVVGPRGRADTDSLLAVAYRAFSPHRVIAFLDPTDTDAALLRQRIPLLAERGMVSGKATAYVCEKAACLAPVTDPKALEQQLQQKRTGGS